MWRHRTRLFGIALAALVVVVYAVSFFLPAVDFGRLYPGSWGPHGVHSGASVFSAAVLGEFIVWLANPVFWVAVGLVVFDRPLSAGIASALAYFLGQLGWRPETDSVTPGFRVLVGYYLWMASFASLTVIGFGLALFKAMRGRDRAIEPNETLQQTGHATDG